MWIWSPCWSLTTKAAKGCTWVWPSVSFSSSPYNDFVVSAFCSIGLMITHVHLCLTELKDLKNNVWGSLRTAWQAFARPQVAALPPVEEGETTIERSLQETQGRTALLLAYGVCVSVCVSASVCLTESLRTPLTLLSCGCSCFSRPFTTFPWAQASLLRGKKEEKSADLWT